MNTKSLVESMKLAQPENIEVIPPNFAAAYAALAPLVAQAWAYKDAGETDIALHKLQKAMDVINKFSEQCLNPMMSTTIEKFPTRDFFKKQRENALAAEIETDLLNEREKSVLATMKEMDQTPLQYDKG